MIRRALAVAAIVGGLTMAAIVLCTTPASAQTLPPESPSTPPVVFLPDYSFHLSAEHLSGSDQDFVWDANFGGEIDVIGYPMGRGTFVANYQVIMGEEFRAFDPNQGNYILGGSASARIAGYEIAGVFHHESRHLADRPKRVPVAWNMMGGRVTRRFALPNNAHADARVDLRGVIAKSFVDYSWELDAGVRSDVPIRSWVGLLVSVNVRHLGVDGTQNRGGQYGYRGEAGVRVDGRAGAAEFFVATERRIDPYPLEFTTARWVTVGFRLVSR